MEEGRRVHHRHALVPAEIWVLRQRTWLDLAFELAQSLYDRKILGQQVVQTHRLERGTHHPTGIENCVERQNSAEQVMGASLVVRLRVVVIVPEELGVRTDE